MAQTPKNVVLSSHVSTDIEPGPLAAEASQEYPKALYHKDSKAGALITKLVQSADEEKEAGDEWVSFQDLDLEAQDAD